MRQEKMTKDKYIKMHCRQPFKIISDQGQKKMKKLGKKDCRKEEKQIFVNIFKFLSYSLA